MKFSLYLCAFLMVSLAASAQAYEGNIEFDKKKQNAFVIEYSYPPEAVENAFRQKLQKLGYKGKEEKGMFNKDKGFRIYKNAFISDISDKSLDYIVKVERKSRKEKDEAVLYLIINKDGENAFSQFDAGDVHRAKSFLNEMEPDVEAAYLEIQIEDQEEVVSKAEKKLKQLEKEKDDLEKKLKDNVKDQEDTIKELENQKKVLENLKVRRKEF